jgi:hypothetical protein
MIDFFGADEITSHFHSGLNYIHQTCARKPVFILPSQISVSLGVSCEQRRILGTRAPQTGFKELQTKYPAIKTIRSHYLPNSI